MLRTRNSRGLLGERPAEGGAWSVLIGAVIAIGLLTLAPSSAEHTSSAFECVFCGNRALADALVNVILYLPFGVGLSLVGCRTRHVLLLGIALSTTIEAAQFVLPGRDASSGDVIANTLGTCLGGLFVRSAPAWLDPSRRAASGLCLGALLLAVAAFASTAYLLTPSFPETTYFGQWTPNLGHLARYRGRVLMATVGRVEIRPRRVQDSDGLRTSLLSGDTVEVWALAGPPVNRLASLFSIYDEFQREIFLVGPDGKDFALRYRTRAADYRLDRPHLRIEQRGDLSPGDSLFVRTWNSTTGRCLQLGAKTKCGIGYTVGSGWSLLFYAESFPRWLKRVLDVGWVAGLFLLVGFWTRTGVTGGTALLVAGLGLVIVPVASPLVMTPLTEWIGAGLGLAGGVALQRAGRPANHSRSTSPTP